MEGHVTIARPRRNGPAIAVDYEDLKTSYVSDTIVVWM